MPRQPPDSPHHHVRRVAVTVRGIVQGVGFRPFVFNAARQAGLSGWVTNEAGTVRIEAEGPALAVDGFLEVLKNRPPQQARIENLEVVDLPAGEGPPPGSFTILPSRSGGAVLPTVPADLATCSLCLGEVNDPAARRAGYPFTNCTNCGPRWSIITSVPYDRPRTSMAGFPLCPACRAEYEDPRDRRFHAQPIACPHCGPHLELLDRDGRSLATKDTALRQAADALLAGAIVAMKGLGGFQLLVDATQPDSVAGLRQRKHRPDKPLAILLADVDLVRGYCILSEDEEAWLTSAAAPILLLRRREPAGVATLAESVAPGNPHLGVMLPYTPLHHLLVQAVGRPLVCTSGNLAEEPMAIRTEEARTRLGNIADLALTHNRPIVRPVDDSVCQVTPQGRQILRRARGLAPAALPLDTRGRVILAVGSHLKNVIGVALGKQVVLSAHVGDLDNVLAVDVHRRAIDDLVGFFEVQPEVVACDLHPDYASTRVAEELAARWQVPLVRVQHHVAHVAAVVAEHQIAGPVLGFSWDGTGYGIDGTVWGGEVIRLEMTGFRRLAALRRFRLPGGDRATREPRRSALGLLHAIDPQLAARWAPRWFTRPEQRAVLTALDRGVNCPWTTSAGRLFDAIAALCGLPATISFEGQAAMSLEFLADPRCQEAYDCPVRAAVSADQPEGPDLEGDWEPMVRSVIADLEASVPLPTIAARFHNGLAGWAVQVAHRVNIPDVALGGGCFQNVFLLERTWRQLVESGYRPYLSREVPPGDGGIALGQLWMAASDSLRL